MVRLQSQHDEMEKGPTADLQAASKLPFAEVYFMANLGWVLIQYFRTPNNFGVVGAQESDECPNELPQNFLQVAVVEAVRVCRTPVSAVMVAMPVSG